MERTPIKSFDSNVNLTPVRFLDSPRLKSLGSSEGSLSACRSRLEVIVKTLQDNYAKWRLAQTRGLALCSAIENIKARALQAESKNEDSPLYPKEMQSYCDKLAVITSIFEDISKQAKESLRQLKALSKLQGANCEAIFYRSWEMKEFVAWTLQLVNCYDKEVRVKQFVMRELPHCSNRADLIRCTSAWEYPQHVDEAVALMFAFLNEELNTEKK